MADYIDRKALRDVLYEQDAITMRGVAIINRFPASDVAPVRHGRIIVDWLGDAHCSFCGTDVNVTEPYCQHCGAKLDGGAENETD